MTQLATWKASPNIVYNRQLAVDSTNVYWVDGSNVLKVGVDGGAVVTLVSGTPTSGPLAVDSTNIYWATASAVLKAPLAGGVSTTLAPGQSSPLSMAIDATNVYWVNYGTSVGGSGSIMKVPISGGTPVTLAAGLNGTGTITLTANTVVWPAGRTIWSVGVTGGTPTSITSIAGGNTPDSLAFNGTDIFIATEQGTGGGTIEKLPPYGGTPVAIVSNLSWPVQVAADTTGVYWRTLYQGGAHISPGTVMRSALDGSAVCTVAVTGGDALAVDATSIYWTTGNQLMKATPK